MPGVMVLARGAAWRKQGVGTGGRESRAGCRGRAEKPAESTTALCRRNARRRPATPAAPISCAATPGTDPRRQGQRAPACAKRERDTAHPPRRQTQTHDARATGRPPAATPDTDPRRQGHRAPARPGARRRTATRTTPRGNTNPIPSLSLSLFSLSLPHFCTCPIAEAAAAPKRRRTTGVGRMSSPKFSKKTWGLTSDPTEVVS